MFIRIAMLSLAALAVLPAVPAPAAAQDAAALLQELQKGIGKELPRNIRITAAGSGYKAGTGDARAHYRIEPMTMEIDSTSPAGVATPIGFLTLALSAKATLTEETLLGTKYKVIVFTSPDGRPVRGYVTEQNVLERIRSERVEDGKGKVPLEMVFFSWQDFGGVRFPSLMIRKENDQVERILVVSKVETGAAAGPPKS